MEKPNRNYSQEYEEPHKKEVYVEKPRTNWEIKVPQVKVIGPEGEFLGLMVTKDAVYKAKDAGLDLVEIVPTEKPPVCKIMNLGKWIFEQKKKKKENQHKAPPMHEIRLTPNTEQHDIEIKAKKAIEFLQQGSKIIIQFKTKGRESQKHDLMKNVAIKFHAAVAEFADMEIKDHTYILTPKTIKTV